MCEECVDCEAYRLPQWAECRHQTGRALKRLVQLTRLGLMQLELTQKPNDMLALSWRLAMARRDTLL